MKTTIEDIAGTRMRHYIGGEWVAPHSARYLDSYDPATGKVWYQAADGDETDIDAAVKAAQAALRDPAWRRITQTERGVLMRRLADWFYSYLEEDYDYRMSDESLVEGIEANEYTFRDDGKRED